MKVIIPLDFNACFKYIKIYSEKATEENDIFGQSWLLAPFFSNITLPFRIKEDPSKMDDYIRNMLLYDSTNFFNIALEIPQYDNNWNLMSNNIFKFNSQTSSFINDLGIKWLDKTVIFYFFLINKNA